MPSASACFVGRWAPTVLILSNRFADKARPLSGLDPKLDEISEKERSSKFPKP